MVKLRIIEAHHINSTITLWTQKYKMKMQDTQSASWLPLPQDIRHGESSQNKGSFSYRLPVRQPTLKPRAPSRYAV